MGRIELTVGAEEKRRAQRGPRGRIVQDWPIAPCIYCPTTLPVSNANFSQAKIHGNKPSRGAEIDAEIAAEEQEYLERKGKA